MAYNVAKNLWELLDKLQFNEPLESDDPRYAETEEGRGDFTFNKLYKALGIDINSKKFIISQNASYNILSGHLGCGKGTELRRITKNLSDKELFFIVLIDIGNELDENNLKYTDILLAISHKLFEKLEKNKVKIDKIFLTNIEEWYAQKVKSKKELKEFTSDLEAKVKIKTGIPFLVELFAGLREKVQYNATYMDEIRKVVVDSFTVLAAAFNNLIIEVENRLKKKNIAKKLLFIIDGTDHLKIEDSRRLFIEDFHQLITIKGNFIYTAPITLIEEGIGIQHRFNNLIMPMIKLTEGKFSDKPYKKGYAALRKLIYKRADKSLFDSDDTVDLLIKYSGGNPRDILKLLYYCILKSDDMKKITEDNVKKAIKDFKSDYERFLVRKDYKEICRIDKSDQNDITEHTKKLMRNLAILHYNNFWLKSHPIVKDLPGYKKAMELDGQN
jgi:hypothetical protein